MHNKIDQSLWFTVVNVCFKSQMDEHDFLHLPNKWYEQKWTKHYFSHRFAYHGLTGRKQAQILQPTCTYIYYEQEDQHM